MTKMVRAGSDPVCAHARLVAVAARILSFGILRTTATTMTPTPTPPLAYPPHAAAASNTCRSRKKKNNN